jgi:serine/threonine protein kinase
MELFLKVPPFQAEHEIDQIRLIYSILGSPCEAYARGLMHQPWYNITAPSQTTENRFRTEYSRWTFLLRYPLKLTLNSILSDDALDFAESLLHLDGTKRPSATDALSHPYFTNLPVATNPE